MIKQRNFKSYFLILVLLLAVTPATAALEYRGFGATRVISGSMHLITIEGEQLLLDAGSFFDEDEEACEPLTEEILDEVSAVLISHTHLDHSGRLLKLIQMGYQGPIYLTAPTARLLPVMLRMAGKYGNLGQEKFHYSLRAKEANEDRDQLTPVHLPGGCRWVGKIYQDNLEVIESSRHLLEEQGFQVCYSCLQNGIERVMELIEIRALREVFEIAPGLEASFYHTPHLPGSVMIRLEGRDSGASLLYTGDFGSGLSPFLAEQDQVQKAQWVLIEGTYEPDYILPEVAEIRQDFRQLLSQALEEGKRVIIPAFVLDRSQQVMRELSLAQLPSDAEIMVFSSSARRISGLYADQFTASEYRQFFSSEFIDQGPFPGLEYSGYQNWVGKQELALVAPGMADAGQSRELITRYLEDSETLILFVGYLDPETLGGRLVSKVKKEREVIRIDDQSYRIKARVEQSGAFSSHGSFQLMSEFLSKIDQLKGIIIVHTEEERGRRLREAYGELFPELEIILPESGVTYQLKDRLKE